MARHRKNNLMATGRLDHEKTYYGLVINLSGVHNRVYRFRWEDGLEGWWDTPADLGFDEGKCPNSAECTYLIYEEKAVAEAVLHGLMAYRRYIRETA